MRQIKLPPRLSYNNLFNKIETGDVLAYSGRGTFSTIIKTITRSAVSHVSIITANKKDLNIFTIAEAIGKGVTQNSLWYDINLYKGEIWWLPLSRRSKKILNKKKLQEFIESMIGKKYDMEQAIKSVFDFHGKLGDQNKEDFKALFCSELVAGAEKAGGVLKTVNASEVTPIDLCRFNIFQKNYFQIKGKARAIRGFNSVSPLNWGF